MAPESGDVPAWQAAVAYIGAFASAIAVVISAWRGKKAEEISPEPARQMVLDHADLADTQPWKEHMERIEGHLSALHHLVKDRLETDAKRQVMADTRHQVQQEESLRRLAEREERERRERDGR